MLKQVTLYGELRENYGRNWSLDINSPSEAMQALAANNPGFRQFVATAHERGVGYKVMVGKTYLERPEEIYDPSGKQEIKVVPVVLGAKKGGLGTVILGIGLMVAAPWMAGAIAGSAGAVGTTGAVLHGSATAVSAGGGIMGSIGGMVGNMMMSQGQALLIGGIGQLLTPTPKPAQEEPENYTFSGVVNTTKQGVAIPVCYGQLMVGGAVISAGMSAEDY